MSIKEKLQIIVITYNREKHLQNTLNYLLEQNSPVKDFTITILDNNSTDNTGKIIKEAQSKHPNIEYIKNNHNITLSGNIARAIEIARMEYVWILGDDDICYWQNFHHLEKAVNDGKEIICAANYCFPKGEETNDAFMILQMAFISANIYKTSILTDTTIANVVNNIYTLFPHLSIIVNHINKGKKAYLLPEPLVSNGMQPGTDCSYTRGLKNTDLYLRQRSMSWIVGMSLIVEHLKDKALRYECIKLPIQLGIHQGWLDFYKAMYQWYLKQGNWLPIFEIMRQIPIHKRILMLTYLAIKGFIKYNPILGIYTTKDTGTYMRILWKLKFKIWPHIGKKQK